MSPARPSKFSERWSAVVRRLPTICPPMGPTVCCVVLPPLFAAFGITPWLTAVGLLLFALAPQWDSCILGLLDFLAAAAVLLSGAVATVHRFVL